MSGRAFSAAFIVTLAMTLPSFAVIKGDKALGEYLASECVTCHQLSGKQVGAIPAIVGVDAQSFVALMDSYRKKERENQVMQAIAAKFTDEEIAALAVFFESVKPKK
jgi:cytochrome c553